MVDTLPACVRIDGSVLGTDMLKIKNVTFYNNNSTIYITIYMAEFIICRIIYGMK